MITYERLEEDGAEFGDERLGGVGSKYDDLRNAVKAFCRNHDVGIDELQETYDAVADRIEPQYFVAPANGNGYMTLTHLEHSSGRSEWRPTIFDPEQLQSTTIGGQAVFTQFPRLETDDVRVFETIASADEHRQTISEHEFEQLHLFVDELGIPSTWQNDILSRQSGDSDIVNDIKQLCSQLADSDEEVSEEAAEIVAQLADYEMSDWAENQLQTIYRRRRRYGTTGTIRRLHHKLTEEIELVDPETVIDADVALGGQLEPPT